MNTIKIAALLLLFALPFAGQAKAQMTKAECEAAGGEWTKSVANFGTCKIKLTAIKTAGNSQISNITKEECKKAGGTISTDGKDCLIVTKGIINKNQKKNTN